MYTYIITAAHRTNHGPLEKNKLLVDIEYIVVIIVSVIAIKITFFFLKTYMYSTL